MKRTVSNTSEEPAIPFVGKRGTAAFLGAHWNGGKKKEKAGRGRGGGTEGSWRVSPFQ